MSNQHKCKNTNFTTIACEAIALVQHLGHRCQLSSYPQ